MRSELALAADRRHRTINVADAPPIPVTFIPAPLGNARVNELAMWREDWHFHTTRIIVGWRDDYGFGWDVSGVLVGNVANPDNPDQWEEAPFRISFTDFYARNTTESIEVDDRGTALPTPQWLVDVLAEHWPGESTASWPEGQAKRGRHRR